jgi:hypothetical protein
MANEVPHCGAADSGKLDGCDRAHKVSCSWCRSPFSRVNHQWNADVLFGDVHIFKEETDIIVVKLRKNHENHEIYIKTGFLRGNNEFVFPLTPVQFEKLAERLD